MATILLIATVLVLLIVELKVKHTGTRATAVLLLVVVLIGASLNGGIEIGRALQANATTSHLSALFNRMAGLARANEDDALKRDVLRFHSVMPQALSNEESLAEVVGEIENSPPPLR